MVEVLIRELDDPRLVAAARGGDQEAFAELYQRYFDPVYDFVARMTRDRDEAADIAQDTFLKAMNALGGLKEGASFKSWIFTIARNTALNRIERASRTRPLTFEDDEGEEVSFQVVDDDRFGHPEEAAEANAVASLVWEAAATLDPKQLSLLDLHLRQGLDSAEIADVLGVTKNNGYVMLNRLKKAVEEAIGAFVMLNHGRRYCERLDSVLVEARIEAASPEARKLVSRHIADCDECGERKKRMVAPLAVFGAFVPVAAPPGLKADVLGQIMSQWPAAAATASSGPRPAPSTLGAPPSGGPLGRVIAAIAGFGGAAFVLGVALLWPGSPLALTGSDQDPIVIPVADPTETATPTPAPTLGSTATPTPATAGANGTPAATPTLAPAATPSPQPSPEATTPPGGPGTPTATATATPTPAKSPTPSPTVTRTATPTPTVCVPSISSSAQGQALNMGQGSQLSFVVFNGSGCASIDISLSVAGGASWLSVSPSGATVAPFKSMTATLTANRAVLSPGQSVATVLVIVPGTSVSLSIEVLIDGPAATPTPTATPADTTPPAISVASGVCSLPTILITVSVSDASGVAAVAADNGLGPQQLQRVAGTPQSGRWQGTFVYATFASDWHVTATDTAFNNSSTAVSLTQCP